MGVNHSVSTNLKDRIPSLKIVKCRCYIEALSAKYAMVELPSTLTSFLSDLYNYINAGNGTRKARWKQVQRKFYPNQEALEVLKPFFIRWLQTDSCIRRINRRRPALKFYLECELNLWKLPKEGESVKEPSTITFLLKSYTHEVLHDFSRRSYRKTRKC